MQHHEIYMQRCLQLAQLGAGFTAPNPMVGAILVYGNRIIGEGYHQQYGQAHAEVNCINSVAAEDKPFIAASTIYVSLEPCAHYGKTPPCADLIIHHAISKVVVGCRDPFEEVDGKGIEKLQKAGIEVIQGVLEKECIEMNKRFFTFHLQQRPYIILKWAQSKNGMIAKALGKSVAISNEFTNRKVHYWRSQEAGIMVGTNTALNDDPKLSNRLWTGNNPVRLVVDLNLRLPDNLNIFDNSQRTIILNYVKQAENGQVLYYKLHKEKLLLPQVMQACYQNKILSILVEGGTQLLQTFIDNNLWDEARVIENIEMIIDDGLAAPVLHHQLITGNETLFSDSITYYKPATA